MQKFKDNRKIKTVTSTLVFLFVKGQRIKLIRAESIGNYSWDNKPSGTGSSISGNGSNDWSDSTLQEVLNNGAYYNQISGICPSGQNGVTIECDFTSFGLLNYLEFGRC